MALARAFTTIGRRRGKSEDEAPLQLSFSRIGSLRNSPARPILRDQISSPITLVSTSNMQVHDAQCIAGTTPIEIQHVGAPDSPKSSITGDDSDTSAFFSDASGSANVTDASSVDESPFRESPGPEPNHLSCYFKPAVDTTNVRSRASTNTTTSSARPSFDESTTTPKIPQRVPSHSKQAHERLHRKRSIQRMISPSPSARRVFTDTLSTTAEALGISHDETASTGAFVEAPRESSLSPFSNELAQLDEVAEEFGHVLASSRHADLDPEAAYLEERGLACFGADDYAFEIQALVYETFGVRTAPGSTATAWI